MDDRDQAARDRHRWLLATLHDPEGNVLQLWQPDGADQRGPGSAPA